MTVLESRNLEAGSVAFIDDYDNQLNDLSQIDDSKR